MRASHDLLVVVGLLHKYWYEHVALVFVSILLDISTSFIWQCCAALLIVDIQYLFVH